MKYAELSADGLPTAFYDDAIHTPDQIPAGAVEITDAQWRECLEHPGLRRFVKGGLVPYAPAEQPTPVPASVTNYQARAVMRQFKMGDGRSLFTTVDSDLRAAVEASKALDEFDPQRVEADLSWQAWEQANTYDRKGAITQLLAGRYGFDEPTTDELFRQADLVTA